MLLVDDIQNVCHISSINIKYGLCRFFRPQFKMSQKGVAHIFRESTTVSAAEEAFPVQKVSLAHLCQTKAKCHHSKVGECLLLLLSYIILLDVDSVGASLQTNATQTG